MFDYNFYIEDLIYIPTGDYNPMFNRPYQVNPSADTIEILKGKLEENHTSNITTDILSGYASNFIAPSAVGYQTNIDQGWVTTKRFIFLLKASFVGPTGNVTKLYIQGYTNYDGISQFGTVDPNLLHHINNVIETTVFSFNTPMGIIVEEKLNKIYNVVTNTVEYCDIFLQRPRDIFSNVMFNDFVNTAFTDYTSNPQFNSVNSQNKNCQLSGHDKRSIGTSIENNVPTMYLARILNAGLNSKADNDFALDSMYQLPTNTAFESLPEPSLQDNLFIHKLSLLEGNKLATSTFRFSTLHMVNPDIVDRFKLLNITKDFVDPNIMRTPNVGEFWDGQDLITPKAYSIIESSVSLAVRYGFSKLYFTASNMLDMTGQPHMVISYFNSFLNLKEEDFNRLLSIFQTKYLNEVVMDECRFTNMPIHIEMYVDILGTSKINLSYGGSHPTWYTIPTFANSNFIPVVTINKTAFDETANAINNSIELLGATSNRNFTYA
jgi:hypothetical protein